MSLWESSSRTSRYDPHSSSLDEIIRHQKEEGVVFRSLNARYKKRSKFERYVDKNSDTEEDEEDFPLLLGGGRRQSSEIESDEEEEPISIPLHGGLDDDSFYHSEGASLPNQNEVEEHFAEDQDHGPLNEEDCNDSTFHQRLPGNSSIADSAFQYAQDFSHCDNDEPVNIQSGHEYGSRMVVKRSGGLKRKLDVGLHNDGGDDKRALGVTPEVHRVRRNRPRTNAREIGNVWKSMLSKEDDTDMIVEEVVISDDEDEDKVVARDKKKIRSDVFRKDMIQLQSRVSEEISKKDYTGFSLNDIISKAKQYFGSPSSLNNTPGSSHGPHGCPEEIVRKQLPKYWSMRYQLFPKYDEGIQLDYESWYSVTPEVIAKRIAQRCKTDGIIIDAFCGCGGNSIQFAKLMKKVIAVDIDPVKIKYAENNARIYGVLENIHFIVGDFMKIAPALKADAVFLSPPWGGPSYLQEKVFDLRTMIPMDGFKVFQLAQNISRNVAYFVPRTTSHEQLLELGGGSPVEIEENILNGRKITYTAYYGDFAAVNNLE